MKGWKVISSRDTAIRVESLGKRYAVGRRHGPDTFRDALTSFLSPARMFMRRSREHMWALRDVSLEIGRGEVVGFVGGNGAGKSTLLKILSRITVPTVGSAEVRGRVTALLEVGTGFHSELTGRENVMLNGAIMGMRRREIERRFDEIVAFAGVEDFIDTPVKHYSSGMRVRLGFAVAAHLKSEILLIDEVLSVGDLAFQQKCFGTMHDLVRAEGRTVLFVSHKMGAVRRLCRRAYWFDQGRIRASGPSDRVVDLYEQEMRCVASAARTRVDTNQTICVPDLGVEISSVIAEIVMGSGQRHSLRLTVGLTARKRVSRLALSLSIYTPDGILVSKIGSRVTAPVLQEVSGNKECTFEFDEITRYLAGGEYFVDISVTSPQLGTIVQAEQAARFEIPLVDVYNVGKYFSAQRHGLVPLPVRVLTPKASSVSPGVEREAS